jgi:hypothetical protein
VRSDADNPERDERRKRMTQFREDPGVQVLLSSEVGSEGLDFQFARVLVNYDLPWNPMVVEQRIGRLDRLGQKADKITIINLSLPGTIEHEILARLFHRIGIFEHALGDLEAILGDEIERLTRDLLTRQLTPEEEAARIDQTAKVIEDRKRQFEHLEREGDRFVGRDAFFDEQLERARRGGEVLGGKDLQAFVTEFLERRYPNSRISKGPSDDVFWLQIDQALEGDLRSERDGRPIWHRLLRRISLGRGRVAVTFSSQRAFGDDELEFLAPHHPLLRLAISYYAARTEELHPVSAVGVAAGPEAAAGRYVYGLYEITIQTGRERIRLEPFMISVQDGAPLERQAASLLFGRMLREGSGIPVTDWDARAGAGLFEELENAFVFQLAEDRKALMERLEARAGTRLASLESSFRRKLRRKEELLAEARQTRKPEHYLRLLEGTIRNLQAVFEERKVELEKERSLSLRSRLVAIGLLEVNV